ncbi:hypothetical protein [Streptomyces platensis]|uniref:hypothetical protein n=1 Tax=Streptomyces platensis TaxID=58346 RepID=UPI00367BD2E6
MARWQEALPLPGGAGTERGIGWPCRARVLRLSKNHTAQPLALALRGADGHNGPFSSVALLGEKRQFSWNKVDVLNWSTKKRYVT